MIDHKSFRLPAWLMVACLIAGLFGSLAGCEDNRVPSKPSLPTSTAGQREDSDRQAGASRIETTPSQQASQSPRQASPTEPAESPTAEPSEESMAESIAVDPGPMTLIDSDNNASTDSVSHNEPTLKPSNPIPTIDPPPFRLLLPTEVGPLLVDLEILIDDVPLAIAFERRIKKVIADADADADDDQSTNWDEFLDFLASDSLQFGQNFSNNNGNRRNQIRLHDRNRNGRVEFEEAVKVLFRSSGFETPFRLRGTDYFRGRKSDSRLFDAIDADDSGGLNADEIAAAASAIFRLDRNTDQRIDWVEVMPTRAGNDSDPAWKRRRSNRHGSVATDLYGYVDWSMMSYSIENLVGQRPFGLPDNPFESLDENDDDSIDAKEAKNVLQCDPDLILTVKLPTQVIGQASVSIRWISETLQPLVQIGRSDSQVVLGDSSLQLCVAVHDRPNDQNQSTLAALARLDANQDGELDQDEIPDQLKQMYPLEDFDADNNGKLSLAEINSATKDKSPIWSVQVRGRAAEFPDTLFAALDVDHDHSLSTREIVSASDRLSRMADDRAELDANEIASMFFVQIVRGASMQGDRLFDNPTTMNLTNDDRDAELPRWARRMDSNSDGEISRGEFLGTQQQFDSIDTSSDGFIDVTEVQSIENSK